MTTPTPVKQTTYGLILAFNNRIFGKSDLKVLEFGNPVSSAIYRIDMDTAMMISTHLKRGTIEKDLPLSYTLACIAQESLFDPQCFNKNLRGSNREDNPAKYDIGLCQLNLRYLIDPKVPGRSTLEEAREFAHDLDRAIPYFLQNQKDLLDYAKGLKWGKGADPRTVNPYFVASTLYNMGRAGGAEALRGGPGARSVTPHAASISKLESRFALELGLPSVMTDVLEVKV